MVEGEYLPAPATKKALIQVLREELKRGAMTHYNAAYEIACFAHAGERRRKYNEEYMCHVLNVHDAPLFYPDLNLQFDDTDRMLALCHDVLESKNYDPQDNWTLEDFKGLGFDDEFTEALQALSKQDPQERYFDYIVRVGMNDRARRVKLADMTDNLRNSPSDLKKFQYEIGIHYLSAIEDGRIQPGFDILRFRNLRMYQGGVASVGHPSGASEMLRAVIN